MYGRGIPKGVSIGRLMKRDKNRCHICGQKVLRSEASRDHVVPRSEGGSGAASNLALAHRKCNNERHTDPVDTRVTPRGWRKPPKHPAKDRR